MRLKKSLGILSVILSGILFTGCNSWVKQIKDEESKPRTEVNIIYDIDGDYMHEYVDYFNAKYPDIGIKTVLMPSNEAKKYLQDENNREKVDVWLGNSIIDTMELKKQNYLKAYKPDGFEKIQNEFKDNDQSPYWTGLAVSKIGVVKSKDLKISKDNLIEYITSNEAKGNFILLNPEKSTVGYLFIKYIYDKYGEEEAKKIFLKIKNNNPIIEDYSFLAKEKINKEECKLAIITDYDALFAKWDDYELDTFELDDNIFNIESIALINRSNIKNESKTFIDFMISDLALNLEAKYRENTVDGKKSLIEGAQQVKINKKTDVQDIEKKKKLLEMWKN